MPSYAQTTISLIFVSLQLLCAVVCMQLNATAMNAIITPELKTLLTIFEKYGFKNEIRIAGGAVRDLLYGRIPADLDLATVATPQEMKEMFSAENIYMLNVIKTETHGTIRVRINNKENFEITTLRNETMIDGVINKIDYIKDWRLDSARRDLTINGMYLDFEGNLYDYYNGYEDLKNNRVRIIGDANKRIKEDPMIILRYMRFFGRIAKDANHNHDELVLQAIPDNAFGLNNNVLRERIWSELQRILSGNFVKEIVKLMLKLGLAPYIGLGENPDDLNITGFDFVCNMAAKYQFKPVTFVASLLKSKDQVSTFCGRMKSSRFDLTMGHVIIKYRNEPFPDEDDECFKYCQKILVFAGNQEPIRAGLMEVLKILDRGQVVKFISEWTIPQLRIDFDMLKEKGIISQKQVGQVEFAKKLKQAWFDNNYVLSDDVFTKVVLEFKNKTRII